MYLATLMTALLAYSSTMGHPSGCVDQSGHEIHMIEVEPGVEVEVLEWSKSGAPILFLAGLGNTGHVYDEFAYQFTGDYRVLALTRRGFGRSSKPEKGYSTDRLTLDIKKVIDSLKINTITLAGHSIAGEELVHFAVNYPGSTTALVFLDSAYDHTEAISIMQEFPPPAPPQQSAYDSRSLEAFAAYGARTNVRLPLAEVCAISTFEADGRVSGSSSPGYVFGALLPGLLAPKFDLLKVPTLAIYTIDRPLDQDWPFYYELDEKERKAADRFFEKAQDWARKQRGRFRTQVPGATIRDLVAADHYLFLSHEGHVAYEISRFLSGLSPSNGN